MATLAESAKGPTAAALIKRAALLLGYHAKGPAAASVIRSASFMLAVRARVTAAAATLRAAALSLGLAARRMQPAGGQHLASLVIVCRLGRMTAGPKRKGEGPGHSAGEFAGQLPAAWLAYPLPVDFIGKKVAALALARGEPWALAGQKITIGGRVLIDAAGSDVFAASLAAAKKIIDAATLEAVQLAGGLSLPAGEGRDAWLSAKRAESASYLKRYGRAFVPVVVEARRVALVADLRFMELRV